MSDKPLAHPGLTDEQRALEAKIDDFARRYVEKRDVNGLSEEQDRWLRASLLPGTMPGRRFAAATEPHFNALLPAEAEVLALLAEEAGEVVQAIGKTLRHGLESTPPCGDETNRSAIARELGDLRCATMLAVESFVLDENEIATAARQKRGRVTKYLHHVKVEATLPTFRPAQAGDTVATLTRTVEEQRATIERLEGERDEAIRLLDEITESELAAACRERDEARAVTAEHIAAHDVTLADLAETRACLTAAREELVKAWQEKDAAVRALRQAEADVRAAAGELLVNVADVPPGSVVRQMLIANATMRSAFATARLELATASDDLEAERAGRRVEVAKCLAIEAERDTARRELAEARADHQSEYDRAHYWAGTAETLGARVGRLSHVLAAVRAAREAYDEPDSTPATLIDALDEALDHYAPLDVSATPAEARRGLTEEERAALNCRRRALDVLKSTTGLTADEAAEDRTLDRILSTPSHQTSGTGEGLTYDDLDAVIAADGRGWLESDWVTAIFEALKARGLCRGDVPPTIRSREGGQGERG